MSDQAIEFTPTSWVLLITWIVFNLVVIIAIAYTSVTVLRQPDHVYGRLRMQFNKVLGLGVIDVLWLTAVLFSAGVNDLNLICLPVIFAFVLVPIWLIYRRFFRKMIEKEREQSATR